MKKLKIKILAITLILVLCLAPVAATGCLVDLDEETQESESPPVTEEDITTTTEDVTTTTEDGWSVPVGDGQAQILPEIADVVALVKPAVVSINTEVVTLDMFNRQYTAEGAGSGWIIDEQKGYIVTNNHVVEDAESITVDLYDGRSFTAEIVGTDPLTDLAVVKIDSDNLTAAKVGDSAAMRVGDWVVAIGNSLGQAIRATQGIVSRQGASVPEQGLYGLIETDAAINPGNSGGPLVNMAGEVIGITNAKLASVEIENVGYAISTETAVPVIEQLISLGHAIHPWLGVGLYTVNELAVEELSLKVNEGALITELAPDSPADSAGLQRYDVIVVFNGKKVESVDDLVEAIRSAEVGQEVEIVYWRGETKSTTSATLIERPETP